MQRKEKSSLMTRNRTGTLKQVLCLCVERYRTVGTQKPPRHGTQRLAFLHQFIIETSLCLRVKPWFGLKNAGSAYIFLDPDEISDLPCENKLNEGQNQKTGLKLTQR